MPNTMSAGGYALLRRCEGCVLWAYDDADPHHPPIKDGDPVRGTLTIGYGHTGPDVRPGLTWTQQQADDALARDVDIFASQIAPGIKRDLTSNQFSALVCLAYNIGSPAFNKSTALQRVNAGQLDQVPDAIRMWCKTTIGGVTHTIQGLVNRREAECTLWATA
jgi:lysozyme